MYCHANGQLAGYEDEYLEGIFGGIWKGIKGVGKGVGKGFKFVGKRLPAAAVGFATAGPAGAIIGGLAPSTVSGLMPGGGPVDPYTPLISYTPSGGYRLTRQQTLVQSRKARAAESERWRREQALVARERAVELAARKAAESKHVVVAPAPVAPARAPLFGAGMNQFMIPAALVGAALLLSRR